MSVQDYFNNFQSSTSLSPSYLSNPSSTSLVFTSVKKQASEKYKWTQHKWASNLEYLLITTFTCVTIQDAVTLTIKSHKATEPCLGHYLVTYIIVAIPLVYTHVFIGQYSQLGVKCLKHLIPLGHGISYCFVMRAICRCTFDGLHLSYHLLYLVSTFRVSLEWMECPSEEETKIPCWDGKMTNCTSNCLQKGMALSASIFFKQIFLKQTTTKLQTYPEFTQTVMSLGSWLALFLLSKRGIKSYIRMVKINAYTIIILAFLLLLVCILSSGAINGLTYMFYIPNGCLINMEAWAVAIYKTVCMVLLGQCFHLTYGSYMSQTMHSNVLSTSAVCIIILFDILVSCLMYCMTGIILNRAHSDLYNLHLIWERSHLPQFSIVPQGLGYLGASQLWTAIYFLTCIFLLLSSLVIKLDAIENCICELHPGLKSYRTYTLAAVCIYSCVSGIVLSIPANFTFLTSLTTSIMPIANSCNNLVFTILVYWVYRVERLSDDIHFLSGKQPTQYIKICWYLMPLICLLPCFHYLLSHNTTAQIDWYIYYGCLALFLCPLLLFVIVNMFKHLKMHNLVSMIQPDERWGPPDAKERLLRRMFNPREETKLRRRNDKCRHKCLWNSKVFEKALEEEDDFYYNNEIAENSNVEIVSSHSDNQPRIL